MGGIVLFLLLMVALAFLFWQKESSSAPEHQVVFETSDGEYCQEINAKIIEVPNLSREEKINTILQWVETIEKDSYENQIIPDQRKIEMRQEWESHSEEKINEWYRSFTGLAEASHNCAYEK